jgi:hypothetical protein
VVQEVQQAAKVRTVEIPHLAPLLLQVVVAVAMILAHLVLTAVVAVQVVVAVQAEHELEVQELKDKETQAAQELVVEHLLVVVAVVPAQLVLTQSLIKVETEAPVKTLEYQVFRNGMPVAVVVAYIDRVVLDQVVLALAAVEVIMLVMALTVHLVPVAAVVVPAVEILMVLKAAMAAQAA